MASAKGARTAAIWGTNLLQGNEQKLLGELGQGFDFAKDQYGTAQGYYQPYADRYGQASSLYSDALGLNGADGTARATGAYQTSPGYQFTMDQGLQALARQQAAKGMLATGNTDADTLKFATGLANQDYGNWLSRLSDMDARGLQTAGAQAGTATGLGNLGYGYYSDRAGVMDDTTKNIVGLGTGALKAGDEAKAANQNMLFGGLKLGAGLLGNIAGLGTGGGGTIGGSMFNKLFG